MGGFRSIRSIDGARIWTIIAPNPDPEGYSDIAGILGLFYSGIYATTLLLDRIPFSKESSLVSNLTLQPIFSAHSKRAGLALQYLF